MCGVGSRLPARDEWDSFCVEAAGTEFDVGRGLEAMCVGLETLTVRILSLSTINISLG